MGRERVTTITIPWGSLPVLLDRVQRTDQAPIRLFSQETLKDVPAAYASMQERGPERYFPAWSSGVRFLSIPLWRWAVALLSIGVGVVSERLLGRVLWWGFQTGLRKKLNQGMESLRIDTPYSVVQKVLDEVMRVLRTRSNIDNQSLRARVVQLTSTGPQIEVFAYYRKPGSDYPAFLEEQEKILMRLCA